METMWVLHIVSELSCPSEKLCMAPFKWPFKCPKVVDVYYLNILHNKVAAARYLHPYVISQFSR